MRLTMLMFGLVLFLASSCGKDEVDAEKLKAEALNQAQAVKAQQKERRHPTSEEGLIEAVAEAVEARDLPALQRLVAPEQAADLQHRLATDGPDRFWRKGKTMADQIKTGFVIAKRQDPRDRREWRIVLRYSDGEHEAMVVTRVDGKLVLKEL